MKLILPLMLNCIPILI
ncbi:UNVERIFIED_CONTAM: hypothetical protein GTU68_060964 [Idotea baltica]|nr:hypothetical protein [Idotea baltica]